MWRNEWWMSIMRWIPSLRRSEWLLTNHKSDGNKTRHSLFALFCCAALFVGSTAYLGTSTYDMVRTICTIPYLENKLSVTRWYACCVRNNERENGSTDTLGPSTHLLRYVRYHNIMYVFCFEHYKSLSFSNVSLLIYWECRNMHDVTKKKRCSVDLDLVVSKRMVW